MAPPSASLTMAYTQERLHRLPYTASAPAVRQYLAATLVNEYGLDWKEANALASPWKYGRGADMHEFDQPTFRAILGAEVGAILWLHVRRVSNSQKQTLGVAGLFANLPSIESLIYLCFVYSAVCGGIAALMMWTHSNMQDDGRGLAKISTVLFMVSVASLISRRFLQL
ncbi:hypothetical protein VHEMI09765 [[Torrubiella] hemipterigena]|uniref:Uncharacterized protein n=1 Tax=[Torrubiella] hemipterigena TaxID=1531966 RepID=A0A0A1TB26_9HYPO|nr:hypothetical protein VHEMI09765 [[Torrubiella] hemipterigena]